MITARLAVAVVVLTVAVAAAAEVSPPTRAQVETVMGLVSEGDVSRGQLDTVGFVVTAEQAEDVVTTARRLEGLDTDDDPPPPLAGAVCPHDDHLYAARVLVHATDRIRAPRVILIGVFHKARLWDLEDRLVFDSFESWHGPWGPVPVDALREELIAGLEPESIVISNTMHCREHSLEGIVPFLQATNREVRIVPILVPYMGWEVIERRAEELATALAWIMNRHQWRLGEDVAVIVSSDAVHYGPDFGHAPFGTDVTSYQRAVARELELVRDHLEGPLDSARLEGFFEALVDPGDIRTSRIPWCGRFSIPVGLELLRRLAAKTGQPIPEGRLLRSGTSLSEPELPVSQAARDAGLGYTAPSNFHHWVGYASIGYSTLQP